jgi:hypothetical protein
MLVSLSEHFKCGCNSELNNTLTIYLVVTYYPIYQKLSSYLHTYLTDQSFQHTANGSAL